MTTLIEKSILNERLEKSRSGIYADTSENRRKHRVGQKYGSEKKEEEKPEKTSSNEKDPAKELEAVDKVIAAINEGKLKLPQEEIMVLIEKKNNLELAKRQAEKIHSGVKANEEKRNAAEAKEKAKLESKKKKEESSSKKSAEMDSGEKTDSPKEKEKKADEKNSKKAGEVKERDKGKESKSEGTSDGKSLQKRKVELLDKYHEDLDKMNKAHEQEQDRIMKELDDEVDNKKRKELWTSLKEKTNNHNEAANRLWKEYESNLDKLEKEEDAHYDKLSEKEEDEVNLKEETEVYTRVKFDDVPNSGKINLKKYLSEKVRKGVDEKWSNIKNIPTENLKKMEKGLVNDLNKNFEAIKKSQRAELLYSIMKVKGELESRGKETQKKE